MIQVNKECEIWSWYVGSSGVVVCGRTCACASALLYCVLEVMTKR